MSEYVIVRREPTQEMQLAGARSIIDGQDNRGASWAQEAAKCHAAMCAASPRPQSVLTDGEILSALRPLYSSEKAAAMASLMDIADARAIEATVLRKLGGE